MGWRSKREQVDTNESSEGLQLQKDTLTELRVLTVQMQVAFDVPSAESLRTDSSIKVT